MSHPDLPEITDPYKKARTSVVLENQERAFKRRCTYQQSGGAVGGTGIDNWNPILISLVRRSLPNLIAYDICGVQPMTAPTGLVFCMKPRYNDNTSRLAMTEALLYNEFDTDFSGAGTHRYRPIWGCTTYATGTGMTTADAEAKGDSA